MCLLALLQMKDAQEEPTDSSEQMHLNSGELQVAGE